MWLSFSIRWLLEIFVKQKRNAVQQVQLPPVLSKSTHSCTLAYPWICCNLSFMQHSTCNFVCGSRAVFSYSSHVLAVYFLATPPTSVPYLPSFVAATCARTHTERRSKQTERWQRRNAISIYLAGGSRPPNEPQYEPSMWPGFI